MGKCVVCSKSAGPFHELHKSCLTVYQSTRKCLQEKFSDCIENTDNSSDAVEAIQSCKPTEKFSQPHFKKLVVKIWQQQAKLIVKSASFNLDVTKALLHIANGLEINNEDVDDYLLTRLENLECLNRIQNMQAIEKSFEHVPEGVELEQHEAIVWEFKNTAKQEQQRYSQDKQWTVLSSVLNNILTKKRYKDLAVKIEESGTLFITNQSLYYKNNNDVTQTKYREIYSITPIKNGVKIQARTKGAMPDTYVTGDGRFTYALLQYAQGLNT